MLVAVALIGGGWLLLSGDDDDDEELARTSDTSEDSDDPTPTTDPDERETTTTRPAPTTTEPPSEVDLDDIDLVDALLTDEDISSIGLEVSEYDPDATSGPDRGEYDGGPECDAMISVYEETSDYDGPERSFTDDAYFSVHHYVERVGEGLPSVDEVQEATDDCPTLGRTGEEVEAELSQEIVPTAPRGDTSIASVVSASYDYGDEPGYESTSFQIEWERDGVHILISLWEADPVLTDSDRQLLAEDLADLADDLLDSLLGD